MSQIGQIPLQSSARHCATTQLLLGVVTDGFTTVNLKAWWCKSSATQSFNMRSGHLLGQKMPSELNLGVHFREQSGVLPMDLPGWI